MFDEVGNHLGTKGHEFGATTGRSRRCGWFDGVALRRAAQINSLTGLCITKLDVLDGLETLRLATSYRYNGDTIELPPLGADAIVVSNHGGRVLDYTPGTADVLREIVDAVKGDIIILVDGGIRTGYDVLKMLALGAEGVLIGRDIIRAAVGGGAEGVRLQMEFLQETLSKAMLMTGCSDLSAISKDIVCKDESSDL